MAGTQGGDSAAGGGVCPVGEVRPGWSGPGVVRGRIASVRDEPFPELGERAGQQPGDVHLGDADLLADL